MIYYTYSDNIPDDYVSVGTLVVFVLLCLFAYFLLFITRCTVSKSYSVITSWLK